MAEHQQVDDLTVAMQAAMADLEAAAALVEPIPDTALVARPMPFVSKREAAAVDSEQQGSIDMDDDSAVQGEAAMADDVAEDGGVDTLELKATLQADEAVIEQPAFSSSHLAQHQHHHDASSDDSSSSDDEDTPHEQVCDHDELLAVVDKMEEVDAPKVRIKSKHEMDVNVSSRLLFDVVNCCKHVLQDLPPEEPITTLLPESAPIKPIGCIASHIDTLVVVASSDITNTALDIGSILWLADRRPLGRIFEVFGPVVKPMYTIRFNSQDQLTDLAVSCSSCFYRTWLHSYIASACLYPTLT
jgi:H/ACA ribonucleoprotein complex non-core subunit NAF1